MKRITYLFTNKELLFIIIFFIFISIFCYCLFKKGWALELIIVLFVGLLSSWISIVSLFYNKNQNLINLITQLNYNDEKKAILLMLKILIIYSKSMGPKYLYVLYCELIQKDIDIDYDKDFYRGNLQILRDTKINNNIPQKNSTNNSVGDYYIKYMDEGYDFILPIPLKKLINNEINKLNKKNLQKNDLIEIIKKIENYFNDNYS